MSRPRGDHAALALATLSLAIGVVFLVLGDDTGAAVATMVTCGLTMTVSTRRLLARRRGR